MGYKYTFKNGKVKEMYKVEDFIGKYSAEVKRMNMRQQPKNMEDKMTYETGNWTLDEEDRILRLLIEARNALQEVETKASNQDLAGSDNKTLLNDIRKILAKIDKRQRDDILGSDIVKDFFRHKSFGA
jgi:hypothetical protein